MHDSVLQANFMLETYIHTSIKELNTAYKLY